MQCFCFLKYENPYNCLYLENSFSIRSVSLTLSLWSTNSLQDFLSVIRSKLYSLFFFFLSLPHKTSECWLRRRSRGWRSRRSKGVIEEFRVSNARAPTLLQELQSYFRFCTFTPQNCSCVCVALQLPIEYSHRVRFRSVAFRRSSSGRNKL